VNRIKHIDENGYNQVVMSLDHNPENGLPIHQFDIHSIDWDQVKKELHNELIDRELFTWEDVQLKGGLENVIKTVLKKHLIYQYKRGMKNGI